MRIGIVAVGAVERSMLDYLAGALTDELRCEAFVDHRTLSGDPFFHSERQQSHSSEMLAALPLEGEGAIVLGVTAVDLYIPILTFVFGEAAVGGDRAVVSLYRLRQEIYGLAADPDLLLERLVKEAIHELGHVFGLVHCEHFDCVMARSHEVESIDMKNASPCRLCREQFEIERERRITAAAECGLPVL